MTVLLVRGATRPRAGPSATHLGALGFLVFTEVQHVSQRWISTDRMTDSNNSEVVGIVWVLVSAEKTPLAIGPVDEKDRPFSTEDLDTDV
jgi:hypothetical protein